MSIGEVVVGGGAACASAGAAAASTATARAVRNLFMAFSFCSGVGVEHPVRVRWWPSRSPGSHRALTWKPLLRVLQPGRWRFASSAPLEVRDGERVVALPRRQQRALLAALALRAGEVVSTDRLVDDLWGERAPASATGSLQNTVSALRKALGRDVVRHAGAGIPARARAARASTRTASSGCSASRARRRGGARGRRC